MTSWWRASVEKNRLEAQAILSGQMPRFVLGGRGGDGFPEVPVFVFHQIDPATLERQLRFLRANGYATLSADELESRARGQSSCERAVALTFDDADWTFWTYAYPLLERYDAQAILFAIAGLVPEDAAAYPQLEPGAGDARRREELDARAQVQPMCTWAELAVMDASPLVDVQSHSLSHARIAVAPQIVDFLHPGFERYLADLNVPVGPLSRDSAAARRTDLGYPIFRSQPLLSCRPQFCESPEFVDELTGLVARRGGEGFFRKSGWRKELRKVVERFPPAARGSFSTPTATLEAARRELALSKKLLEDRLGKRVRHFCYPWFVGSRAADALAREAGYEVLHYGPFLERRPLDATSAPLVVRRLAHDHLWRLPGKGRRGLASLWRRRLSDSLARRRSGG